MQTVSSGTVAATALPQATTSITGSITTTITLQATPSLTATPEPSPSIIPTQAMTTTPETTPTTAQTTTPEPTPSLTPTQTMTTSPEMTPTAQSSSTPEPTPSGTQLTGTPEATPSITATTTTTITITPTVTPSETITPTPTETETPVDYTTTLQIDANPAIYLPGKPITTHWKVRGFNLIQPSATVQLRIHVPQGVLPEDGNLAGQITPDGYLTLPLSQAEDAIVWDVAAEVQTPFYFGMELLINGELISQNAIMMDAAHYEIDAVQGGSLDGMNGKIYLQVPGGAGSETLAMDVRDPSPNKVPPLSLTGYPIEIIAAGEASGVNVTQFSQPLRLQVTYDPQLVHGAEADLQLFYYNQDFRDWYPMETTVDTVNHTLTAYTNHLTVFDYKAASWQAYTVPSVDSFKVNDFTGAGTYSMDFWSPPGPGGLKPSISLTYNSQVIDESSAYTQASWVGMGWSLDTGAIVRNMHETNSDTTDDTFSVSGGGMSGLLLPISVNGTYTTYNTADQSYEKVIYNSASDAWTVYGKDGTIYVYDIQAKTNKTSGCSSTLDITWRWSLHTVYNIFGKTLTYAYTTETKPGCSNQIAVYPLTITYPNNVYRIKFETALRTDYQTSWTQSASTVLYGTQKLNDILVQYDPTGAWTSPTPIRKYLFGYNEAGSSAIFPNFHFSAGGLTLSLTGVQEFSGDASQSLPKTTFSYGDSMHLDKIDNGQGGETTLTYDNWTYFDDINKTLRFLRTDFGQSGQECGPNGQGQYYTTAWFAIGGNLSYVRCDGGTHNLQVGQDPTESIGERSIPEYIAKPGGRYLLHYELKAQAGTTSVYWGIYDNSNSNRKDRTMSTGIGTTEWTTLERSLDMTADYDASQTDLYLECDDCQVHDLQFALNVRYYRVKTRTVTDLTVTPHTSTIYTYEYEHPSPNSKDTSAAVAAAGTNYNQLYTYPLRENRGHAMTMEYGPDNMATVNWYYQTDDLKGKAYRTAVVNKGFYDNLDSTNASNWTFSGSRWDSASLYQIDYDTSVMIWSQSGTASSIASSGSNPALVDGKVAFAAIRLCDQPDTGKTSLLTCNTPNSSTQSVVGLVGSQYPTRQFGLKLTMSGSQPVANLFYNTGSGDNTVQLGNISSGKWYMVMLMVDNTDGFKVRLWQLDNPSTYYEGTMSGFATDNWQFKASVSYGSLFVDSYLEGVLYSENLTSYTSTTQYDTNTTNGIPDLALTPLLTYKDLSVVWTRPTTTISLTYATDATNNIGDAKWIGRKTDYAYDSAAQNNKQYGNLTAVTESIGTSSSAWATYRQTNTWYYPNDTSQFSPYLVNFPAYTNQYACGGGSTCTISPTTLLSSVLYFYDSNTSYDQQPTAGVLVAKRTQLSTDSSGLNPTFQDEKYFYDAWANVKVVERYTQPGTSSNKFIGTGQIATTNYDNIAHTYVSEQYEPANPIPTRLAYDYTCGEPILEIDRSGNITTADYDKFGRLLDVIRPGDSVSAPTFHVIYHDVGGSNVRFWTEAQQLIDASNTLKVRKFYNGLGQLVQTQTAHALIFTGTSSTWQDVITDYRYDALGRLVQQSVPYNVTTGSDYVIPDLGQSYTQTAYDLIGRAIAVTMSGWGTVEQTIAYSLALSDRLFGPIFVTSVTDMDGNTTATSTDVWGRKVNVAPPTGPQTGYLYDPLNRLTTVERLDTTPYILSQMNYTDSAGRKYSGPKTGMTDADMGIWSYTYDALSNLTSQTDNNLQLTCLYYDSVNRMVKKEYENNSSCPASPTSPAVTNTYDGVSRFDTLPGTTWPSGWSRYDSIHVTKPSDGIIRITGKSDWTVYASRSAAISNSPAAVRFTFKINDAGSYGLVELNSGSGAYVMGLYIGNCDSGQYGICYFTRDPINGQHKVYAMALTVGATYEAVITADPYFNFCIQIWDQNNPQGANAQFSVAHPDWAGLSWTFYDYMYYGSQDLLSGYSEFQANGIDQRVQMADSSSGSTLWSYDVRERLVHEQKTVAGSGTFATGWSYNSVDQVATMTYPGDNNGVAGEVVTYSYNPQMAIQGLIGSYTYIFSTDYDAAGRVINRQMKTPLLGDNIKTTYSYYPWSTPGEGGKLSALTSVNPNSGANYQGFTYVYDNVGTITQITDNLAGPQTQTFSYDADNRLTAASATPGNGGGYSENYYYDSTTGNMSKTTPTNYHYGVGNNVCFGSYGLHAVVSVDSPASSYNYDCNGNMTSRTVNGVTYTLGYDRENRLTSVTWTVVGTPPTNYLLNYTYDGDGNRVQMTLRSNGSIIIQTAYVGNYFEWTSNTMTKYYYEGSVRIAMRVGTAAPIFLLGDHLGSTSKTVDTSNWTVTELRYKAWGEVRYSSGTTATSYRFTGQQDQPMSIGLLFYGARFYDPYISRFTQPDSIIPNPYDPQSYDRYAYSRNNPTNYNDPSGHTPLLVTAAIGALLGAGVNYAIQVGDNYFSKHMDLPQAMSWSNINKVSLIASTVGGFVGGFTLGLSTLACGALGLTDGATAVIESVIGSGVSNVASGQAQALTTAGLDQVVNHTTLNGNDIYFQPNADEFWADAKANGLGVTNKIVFDGGVGTILGTMGGFGKNVVNDLGLPDPFTLGGKPSPWIRPATNFIDSLIEYGSQESSRQKQQPR